MQALTRWHDALSDMGAVIAALCVAVTACIYTAEVIGRYFLDAPLNWSGDVSAYLLCVTAFLALPKVTRENGHIAITYFLAQADERARARYVRAIAIVAGLACLVTAAFVAHEAVEQFSRGVLTSHATRIVKWPIAAVACVGLLSAALHFLFSPIDRPQQEQAL